jgi:competence protein ComGC
MFSIDDQFRSPWQSPRRLRVSRAGERKHLIFRLFPRSASPPRVGRPRHRKAFTFTEILFAVLILGIGFILIAAIFPVAIKQTQTSAEETTAATIAKGGVSYLVKYNTQSNWYTPSTATLPDGLVHPIGPTAIASEPVPTNTTLWPLISGNLILPSDPRYAWVAMYRQGLDPTTGNTKPLPYIQVIVIGVQARNRSFYDSYDLAARTDGLVSLQARPIKALFNQASEQVTLSADPNELNNINCAADGEFIVVANDTNGGLTNGWIYRLGSNVGGVTWNLAPGNDLTNATQIPGGGTTSVSVMVIGAGYTDANSTTYIGPCQDVAAYTTFIPVH